MKKILKNLLACFVILLIFSGAVFFIGWTQIKIKPNCIGVLKSKTGGVLKEPVYPGKFSWHWEFLLPTNAELKIFEVKSYDINKSVSGMLPSGDVYSKVLKSNVSFNYDFDFEFSVQLTAETIVKLYSQLIISEQAGLERYIDQTCDSVAKMLAAEIIKKIEEEPKYHPDTLTRDDLKELSDFEKKYPEIQFNSVILKKSLYPDYSLYNKARSTYLSLLDKEILPSEKVEKSSVSEASISGSEEISESNEEDKAFFNKLKKLLDKQD